MLIYILYSTGELVVSNKSVGVATTADYTEDEWEINSSSMIQHQERAEDNRKPE